MGKQYTFKLTKDTAWMQESLDLMKGEERSLFFRDCIICGLAKQAVTHPGTNTSVTQEDRPRVRPKVTPTKSAPPPDIIEIEATVPTDEELEAKLNSLYG